MDCIKVVCRVKPDLKKSFSSGSTTSIESIDPVNNIVLRMINLVRKGNFEVLRYHFNEVVQDDPYNEDLYSRIGGDGVRQFLKGKNVSFMTYGPKGSGKTYCMFGLNSASRGIFPRVLEDVFASFDSDTDSCCRLSLSFMQVHLDQYNDLLLNSSLKQETGGSTKQNRLTVVGLTSLNQALEIVAR